MDKAFAFGDKSIKAAVDRVNRIRRIAVIGAGTMGQGIVIDLLQKTSFEVVILDIQPEALERARTILSERWAGEVRGQRLRADDARELEARTSFTQSYDDLKKADIIWEAATERQEIKASIFRAIEDAVDPDDIAAIFSNTSSHTTEELAVLFQAESLREKFLTVHGYFPFESNRLIDVMKGKYASLETYSLGVVFADQILEKNVIALAFDHHGYLTDPIFQAMAAIVSWEVQGGQDLITLGGVWDLFTANPFNVLDQTGHMPYTESSRHLGQSLPANDRLRGLYDRENLHYPAWIAALEKQQFTGVNSPTGKGFFEWSDDPRPQPSRVYDPASNEYQPIGEVSRKDFWSFCEAKERDSREGRIKSAESLVFVANADDEGGRVFRRTVLPICLYALDLIQDGVATPGQINISTRAGLRFKVGLIEFIDALIEQLTIRGVLELIHRARDENADDSYLAAMLDTEGVAGPREGHPCLLHEMERRNVSSLLGYGQYYQTPVAEYNFETSEYRSRYADLKFCDPAPRDRVASIVFNCPLRGNVFNHAVIDQLAHAYGRILELHRSGVCGAVLFSAAGRGMRMLGADAKEFNRGWFDRTKGYAPLSEEAAAASSRNAMDIFRRIQRSPVASIGVFGEKWGGGAEFTYFLDLRFDVQAHGFVYDTLERETEWCQKCTYNQPELDFAILPGFGAAGELKRLGMGDSVIFEIFDRGMTADRAHQVGLSNGVFDSELKALRRGYEQARQMAKDAPYSRALLKKELARGADDDALARETADTFNPRKNPYIRSGLIKLLDRSAKPPPMDYACANTPLPGWEYPHENGSGTDER